MREQRHGIPFVRTCHEFLRASELPIAAMNGLRRAIAPTHRVLDASGAGAAGLLALRYGAKRVVVLDEGDTPSVRPGAEQDGLEGRLVFVDAERAALLATQGERFDVVLGPMSAGGVPLDLHYGAKLDALTRRYGATRAMVVPGEVRYSAQLVEWPDATRLDEDVASRARDLGSRYAVDFEPVLEQLSDTPAAGGPVRAGHLRALNAPQPFLAFHPGQSVEVAATPARITLTASRRGRADGVAWLQELVHDGIVIGSAHGCSWLATREDMEAGDTIEVAVADLAHAMPFEDGEAPPRFAPSAPGAADATPLVFWLTGISGAGKTTIATRFKQEADACGWPVTVLDGDALRSGLNADLGFSDRDRAENVRRIAEVAALMADTRRIVVVSCISPKQAYRDMAREIVGASRFVEVFVDTPAMVAEARDPKGLYRRARAGLITSFTSIDSGYEPPQTPRIHLDTTLLDVDAAARILCEHYVGVDQFASRERAVDTVF